jgi:hypothetical protein
VQETGAAKLATSATSGFMNIAQTNGTPAGTPTIVTGAVPITADNNGVLYALSTAGSSWSQAGGAALSSITAATTTSSINSAANAITWAWNSLAGQTALTLSSNSATSGTILNVTDSNAASTGYAGYFSQSGTGTSYGLYVTDATFCRLRESGFNVEHLEQPPVPEAICHFPDVLVRSLAEAFERAPNHRIVEPGVSSRVLSAGGEKPSYGMI